MQKKEFILIISSILLITMISFISAQFYNGIGGLIDYVGGENISLFLIFGVSGLLLKIGLERGLGRDNNLAGILALLLAFGITAMAHFSGFAYYFDINEFFYSFGISEGLFSTIVSLALIGASIYIVFKFSFSTLLIILGGLLIILSFTDFIYETGITIFMGIVFLLIGIVWHFKKKRSLNPDGLDSSSNLNPKQIYKQEISERSIKKK